MTLSHAAPVSPLRAWIAAIRPATLWAGAVPIGVGTALAAAAGALQPLVAAACLLASALLQIGTNLHNDYEDFARGADASDRLGPPRAAQRRWIRPAALRMATAASFAGALAAGTYLVAIGGWPILALGLMAIGAALGYTGGPRPLGYLGLGDALVLVFFGLVAVGGTFYLQTGYVGPLVTVAGLAVGALATAILVVNNLRDRVSDARAGKRTLAVRFGARAARTEYVALLATAYLAPAAVALAIGRPGWLLPLLSLPLAAAEIRGVLRRDGADLNRHLGGTARLELIHGALLAAGVLL